MEMTLTPTTLTLKLTGAERLWAVRLDSELVIPRSSIVSVSTERPVMTWRTLRCPGTALPGVIVAGTYYRDGGKEFWYTTGRNQPVLTLELDGSGPYNRIVIDRPSPLGLDPSTLPLQDDSSTSGHSFL